MLALRYYLAALSAYQAKRMSQGSITLSVKEVGSLPVSAMNVKFCSGCSVPLKVTMKACPLLTINSLLENLLVW